MLSKTRTCKVHGKQKLSKYYKYSVRNKKNDHIVIQYECKLCRASRSKKAYRKNKAWYKEYNRKWWANNKDKSVTYYKNNKDIKLAQRRGFYHKIRREVLSYYSGNQNPFCDCCGEKEYKFLALDHKFGDGAKHRKELRIKGGSGRMCEWAKDNGYPDMFRVLCHNCNHAYGCYGMCPHKEKYVQK